MVSDFICAHCKETIDLSHTRKPNYCGGSGYADVIATGERICYACAGEMERAEMRKSHKSVLYLVSKTADGIGEFGQRFYVSDWSGSFKLAVYSLRHSYHNLAGQDGRRDFYFDFDGKRWHGVNIGNGEISHVRRTKVKARE